VLGAAELETGTVEVRAVELPSAELDAAELDAAVLEAAVLEAAELDAGELGAVELGTGVLDGVELGDAEEHVVVGKNCPRFWPPTRASTWTKHFPSAEVSNGTVMPSAWFGPMA
jgi:hypothetical protein